VNAPFKPPVWSMAGYANDPSKLDACNKWVDAARPIIKAFFVLDDAAQWPLVEAAGKEREGRRWSDPATYLERDYREAQDYIKVAAKSLFEMLDGIRDSFICDERCGLQDSDIAQEAADEFNDWLSDETLSVDAAVALVTAEHNAAFAKGTSL
jgi:hypothetical protein